MQRLYILASLLLFPLVSNGQFSIDHNLILGGNALDEAKDIAVNASRTSLFLGGRSFSTDGDVPGNSGGSDYWIQKRNADGTLVWSKTFGSTGNDDLATVMAHSDGGVLAFGTTHTNQGQFGTINGVAGGWLLRTTSGGVLIDGKIFGGTTTETAVDAHRKVNGDVTLLMEASSPTLNGQTNNGLTDVWVVQVNAAFEISWSSLLGGNGADVPTAMFQDVNGNIYICASSTSDLPGLPNNRGEKDVWIIKLNPSGQLLWQKSFGGSEVDIPTDILFHPSGFVYVTVQSQSVDGDFDTNDGINDLWLIKLDALDGDAVLFRHLGGSGNDYNAHLDLFGLDHLVLTTNSTSDDGDLTGNKGLSDVWVITTDLNGVITQQMNYGGSVNDFSVDVLTIDSVFHVLCNSLSSDKNVPVNTLAQQDMWYFTLDTRPEPCSDQFQCRQDTMLGNELFPPDDNSLLCVSGCTAGLPPGPNFTGSTCMDFNDPTAYFKVHTDTSSELLTLSVTSYDFNEPRIALFKTNNCSTYQQITCATGSGGTVILPYVEISPLSKYVVAISDAAGNVGNFDFCASTLNVDFCNKGDRIFVTNTSKGSPLNGPYKPGEEVTICYELYNWNKLECNGFQGLIPTFGPGWDSTGFNLFGEPLQVDSLLAPVEMGSWDWYKLGDVHYNVSNPINGYDGGQGMPAGWYFTNTGDPPPHDNPDQTTGDINNCLPTPDKWKVCFTLPVVSECESDLDCSISFKTFADGEVGINSSLACVYDQPENFHAFMRCCLNPTISNIQNFSICSGDTIAFEPASNLLPPVTYTWTASPDPFIVGASSGIQAPQFYQVLTNTAVIPFKVRYSIRAEAPGCITGQEDFEITVLPAPKSQISSTGPTTVCSGSPVTFTFQSLGAPPYSVGLYRDNEPFVDILSETNFISIQIDPEVSGRFSIGSLSDANCEGAGTGFVDVIVKPSSSYILDTTLCTGDSILVGGSFFKETGTYEILLDDGAANDCDSMIQLTLDVIPTLYDTVSDVICHGDTLFVHGIPLTVTTHGLLEYQGPEGCPNYTQVDLIVRDTFYTATSQTICHGDTINFAGIKIYLPGNYSHTEEIRPGCFETTTLQLTVRPAIVINDLEIMADNGNTTGAILVEIIGGSPPFTFKWSSGQTTESIFNIATGHYILTVTDRFGCQESFDFDVPFVNAINDPLLAQTLLCYPSLVKEDEKINLYNTGTVSLDVLSANWWNLNGQRLHTEPAFLLPANDHVSLAPPFSLPAGMYILAITLKDGKEIQFKILME